MDTLFQHPLRHLALAAAMTALAACGGGSSSGSGDTVSTGVLTDGPIQGVEYLTSGNLGGSTDASGQFNYRPGETIVFKLGLLPIGVVTGSGSAMTVTPLELIEGFTAITDPVQRQNAVTNMLVLLQSLDSDPDPARIVIPSAAITALQNSTLADTLTTLLTDTPANFSASTAFTGLVSSAGTTAVAAVDALAHFRAQFLSGLAGQYYGSKGNNILALRVRDDGSYLMTEIAPGDPGAAPTFTKGGQPGLERGMLTWDPSNGQVTTSTDLDTNGSRGFNAIDAINAPVQLTLDAGDLIYTQLALQTDSSGSHLATTASYRLARLADSASGPSGAWVKGDAASLAKPVFFFLPGNQYLLLDPVGDTSLHYGSTSVTCGSSGVELGSYQILSSGLLQFLDETFDSNGCAGAHVPNTDIDPYTIQPQYPGTGTWQWGALSDGQIHYRPDNTVPPAP